MRRAERAGVPFDLALLDHMMPGMDGLELAAAVQADPRLRSTPLLMTTSSGVSGLEARAQALGIDRILHKPLRQVDLCRGLLAVLDPAPAGDDDRPRRGVVPAGPRDRLRVLLVEDNPVNQKVASAMLERLGHRVTIAGDGRAGVESYREAEFDLVLMDVQMPEMDGFEALASIRRLEADLGTRTQIVALTAHPIHRDALQAMVDSLRRRPAAPEPGFDRAYALAQAGGDAELVDDLAELFRVHGPRQLDALREALQRGAAHEGALAAHTLKGSAALFLRRESLDAMNQVEQLGKQGRLDEALALLPSVEAVVADLAAALQSPHRCGRVAVASV